MVKYALKISAAFENIQELSVGNPDFEWQIKLQCQGCRDTDPSWHTVSANEEVEAKNGPGSFNFQMKCKFCSSISTVDVVKGSVEPLKADEDDFIDDKTVVIFDCRGVIPVDFDPQGPWIVKCKDTNTVIEEVIFLPGDDSWIDYDEKGKVPVSIEEFKSTFVRV